MFKRSCLSKISAKDSVPHLLASFLVTVSKGLFVPLQVQIRSVVIGKSLGN